MNRVEIWRSLGTDSLKVALRRLPSVAAQIEADIELARASAGLLVDATLLKPVIDNNVERSRTITPPMAPAGPKPEAPLTLSEAYRQYIDDPTRSWSPNTREAYETSRRLAISVIGEATPVSAISRTHCRDLLDVLRFLPANAGKRFPRLSAREASARARLRSDIRVISAANANSLMSNVCSFLNWAVNEELIGRNPARGLRLPDPVARRDKRMPFAREQLHAIFHAPLYTGCIDGERGYNKRGDARPRNARFWVPLIALHTGARLGEICQLDVSDVRSIDNVWCIVITQDSLVGSTDKRLKTSSSNRVIPVHRNLIDCGLLHFAQEKQRAGEIKLFDDIDTGTAEARPVAFSKWFTQFLRASGAQRQRTSFHSFRHNFRDELRAARVDHDIAMLLGGWTTGSSRTAVSENYGSGYRVEALSAAMCSLLFKEVDIRHLMLPS